MTFEDIQALFIAAAGTDRKLPDTARPTPLRAQALPYFHLDVEKAGWIPADYINGEPIPGKTIRERIAIKRAVKDQLEIGDRGRLDEEADRFWAGGRVTPHDVTEWERCNELIVHVEDTSERRCLWHWAIAKSGGRPFNHWCFEDEDIHPETGRRRKNNAIRSIVLAQSCVKTAFKHEIDVSTLLHQPVEIMHIEAKIAQGVTSWMADNSRPLICDFDAGLKNYQWAERQNELRRQRERKRKQEAA
jgi:hypothetical protein